MNFEQIAEIGQRRIKLDDSGNSDIRKEYLRELSAKGLTTELPGDYYKFTNMKSFIEAINYAPKNIPVELDQYIDESIPTLFFVDGDLQNPDLKIDGVKTELLKGITPEVKTHALSNLHRALISDGVRITIQKNAEIQPPIRVLHLISRSGVMAPNVVIESLSNSRATIIEENIALGESYILTSDSFVTLHPGAKLEHIQIEKGGPSSVHHGATQARIDRDAQYKNLVFHIAGKLNRRNVILNMDAPGAHGESFNLYLTNGDEQSDIYTELHHHAADSTSDQLAKGILDGSSRGIFTGKIHIHPDAQRVNSGQLNKNLILSKKAQAHSQPQLEIFADDVKCSHGSTTGQLSPEEVFYFESRGIPLEKAKTLLAHGFGLEVVLKIENKTARAMTSELVLETLKTKFQLGGKS